MIIIFGFRRLRKGMAPILLRCANCGMSPVALLRISTWFALFFIPVIPLSFKHYVACPNCKRLDQISKADVDRAFAQQNAMKAGHEGFADIQSQPATLEHAVNEWASVGPAQSATTDTAPADPAPSSLAGVSSAPPLPPAGWYPDPAGGANQRYWDGQTWTEQTTPPV